VRGYAIGNLTKGKPNEDHPRQSRFSRVPRHGDVLPLERVVFVKFHKDGTRPGAGSIFVFGSNLSGIHGAGAARVALDHYGAKMGRGVGLQGQSFAIPTKDEDIQTMMLSSIALFVDYFLQYASEHLDVQFFVTRIGCGLAGYTDDQIAPLFRGAPSNCNFSEEWEKYL
jgi:hypothetical protein